MGARYLIALGNHDPVHILSVTLQDDGNVRVLCQRGHVHVYERVVTLRGYEHVCREMLENPMWRYSAEVPA